MVDVDRRIILRRSSPQLGPKPSGESDFRGGGEAPHLLGYRLAGDLGYSQCRKDQI